MVIVYFIFYKSIGNGLFVVWWILVYFLYFGKVSIVFG